MPKKRRDQFIVGSDIPNRGEWPCIKPPFGYYGAKQRLAPKIAKMLPPHNAWVEAFCGSAAVTLAKKPAPIEVINDRDGEVVNVFSLLRDNPLALFRQVALTPYARQEYMESRRPKKNLSPLERARRFLVGAMMTVNGTVNHKDAGFSFSNSFTRGRTEARVNRWCNLPMRLSQVAERLRHVRVENRDAIELLKMFLNRPATLVYLDPPYFINRIHGYRIDANNRAFHRQLLKLCCRAKCMILLSGYDTSLYKEMLLAKKGWRRVFIDTHTRATKGKDYARREVLWQNKAFVIAAKSGRVPIRLTRAEKRQKKINPLRS